MCSFRLRICFGTTVFQSRCQKQIHHAKHRPTSHKDTHCIHEFWWASVTIAHPQWKPFLSFTIWTSTSTAQSAFAIGGIIALKSKPHLFVADFKIIPSRQIHVTCRRAIVPATVSVPNVGARCVGAIVFRCNVFGVQFSEWNISFFRTRIVKIIHFAFSLFDRGTSFFFTFLDIVHHWVKGTAALRHVQPLVVFQWFWQKVFFAGGPWWTFVMSDLN